jgi:two-component system, NtrC family, nitrogen regulation response regulator NtrX
MAADILVIDDEADIRELISGILQDEGFETRLAHNSDSALSEITLRRPSLVILDIWLQGSKLDGLDLLLEIKNRIPDLPVVIISGHGNVETAVSAIKRGAYDYIEKPFNADRLLLVVGRALETFRLRRENDDLKGRSGLDADLIGTSAAMKALRQLLKRVAPSNSRVLITGPMGSGKELVARSLHAMSHRASGPFVVLSAATLDPDRIEERLFGVEGNVDRPQQVGALEEAHSGTLYLDEVADMPIETQAKVLRVLLEQNFHRVGGAKKVRVDVRILSSTARDLKALIATQAFREDLYHRLGVVPLEVPALKERREDIPELVEFFARSYSQVSGQPARRFSSEAMAILQTRDWPGNARELRNNVERIMITAAGGALEEIGAGEIPVQEQASTAQGFGGEHLLTMPLREAREVFEKDYITAQLSRFGGNISRTSNFIGMERSALHRKIKTLGLLSKDAEQSEVNNEVPA